MPNKCLVFALIVFACLHGFSRAEAGSSMGSSFVSSSAASSTGTISVSRSSITGRIDPYSGLWNNTVMPCLSSDVLACYTVILCLFSDPIYCSHSHIFDQSAPGCDCFLNFCGCLDPQWEFDQTRDGCDPSYLTCPNTFYTSEPAVRSVDGDVTCKSLNAALCTDPNTGAFNVSQRGCLCYLNYCGYLIDNQFNDPLMGCQPGVLHCKEGALYDLYLMHEWNAITNPNPPEPDSGSVDSPYRWIPHEASRYREVPSDLEDWNASAPRYNGISRSRESGGSGASSADSGASVTGGLSSNTASTA